MDGALVSYGVFGLNLMKCYGDPAAERDGQPGASLKEGFEWMAKMNPQTPRGRLMQLQCPTYYGRGYFHAEGTKPTLQDLWRLDLKLRIGNRMPSAIDLVANVAFDIGEKPSADADVLAISPVREWQLDGELSVDSSLAIDLEFRYDADLDTINPEEGVLGLVRRANDSADWEAYYPAYYDPDGSLIIAENVTDPGQWAIARVADMSSNLRDLSKLFTDFSISPNPVNNGTAILRVHTEQTIALQVTCVSLNGVVCKEMYHDAITGVQYIPINTEALLPGIYYIRLTSGNITGSLPLVIR
jgi:hypothetical protein